MDQLVPQRGRHVPFEHVDTVGDLVGTASAQQDGRDRRMGGGEGQRGRLQGTPCRSQTSCIRSALSTTGRGATP